MQCPASFCHFYHGKKVILKFRYISDTQSELYEDGFEPCPLCNGTEEVSEEVGKKYMDENWNKLSKDDYRENIIDRAYDLECDARQWQVNGRDDDRYYIRSFR